VAFSGEGDAVGQGRVAQVDGDSQGLAAEGVGDVVPTEAEAVEAGTHHGIRRRAVPELVRIACIFHPLSSASFHVLLRKSVEKVSVTHEKIV
jgi:hypothetical protein